MAVGPPSGCFSVDSYKSGFLGGSRQYLFYVTFIVPPKLAISLNMQSAMSYLVKTATIPGITFDDKAIEWSGMSFKMAGNAAYNDLAITLNIDEGGNVLRLFTAWCNLIHDPRSGQRGSITEYFTDQQVQILSYAGTPAVTYKFFGSYPKTLGDISFDYSSSEVATIDVTFGYQYYTILEEEKRSVVKGINPGRKSSSSQVPCSKDDGSCIIVASQNRKTIEEARATGNFARS